MRFSKIQKIIIVFYVLTVCTLAQSQDFDLNDYQEFLDLHQNMNTTQLLEMHPAGTFEAKTDLPWESALYHDSIEIKYKITSDEKTLLQKHGFMVTERLRKSSFGEHLLDIWQKDLPVFISSDAILYAFHFAYDRILVEMEKGYLISRVTELLKNMHLKLPEMASEYSAVTELAQMLRDVDVYLTVPLKLLGENISPYYPENEAGINQILNLISNEGYDVYPFFSEHCKEIDFSQFKPRGHYTNSETLSKYFRAMMWLGRIEIYLLAPQGTDSTGNCPPQSFTDIQRQTIDAVLIAELMDLAEVSSIYSEIEEIISFFVGEQDNVTPENIHTLVQSLNLTTASQLLDVERLEEFQEVLKAEGFAFQRIQSQILIRDPLAPESVQPASAFMLFGQRYVIDSYVTSRVVYDKIIYDEKFICRLFPSTLDVLFTLGNDAVAQLLREELDQYHYATNLAALRYLIDSYPMDFWNSSIYNMWLHTIRALNPPTDRKTLPPFMQTAAWWQQKINTQLASWTELRHDNLLYAKPSYTTGVGCSYPYGYVEPVPELYRRLNILAEKALEKFSAISFSDDYLKGNILSYFDVLQGVTDTLWSISQKELDGISLDADEETFIKSMVYQEGSYAGGFIDGWYVALLYGKYQQYLGIDLTGENAKYLVADYHTTPTDCAGSMMGWVSHAGTGPIDLAVVTARFPGNQTIAFIGPVNSYYEYTTTNFLRLTDEEWNETYWASSSRPDWANLYLADDSGNLKGEGATLLTGIDNPDKQNKHLPEWPIMAKNYPNPFNAGTIISFTIPYHMTNSQTELTVYNIQGKVIKKLIGRALPAGNYLTRWDGRNDLNQQVSSGIYFYKIKVGDNYFTGKMNLIK